jgi:hypothetical protein
MGHARSVSQKNLNQTKFLAQPNYIVLTVKKALADLSVLVTFCREKRTQYCNDTDWREISTANDSPRVKSQS